MPAIPDGPFEGYEEDRTPASLHAEATILGGMLVDSVACNDATELLEDFDFYLDSHRRIYRAAVELMDAGENVDITTVSALLQRKKELDTIGGVAFLASLSEGLPRKLSIESYVRIVRDKSLVRDLLNRCEVATTRCLDGSELAMQILEDTEADLMAITDRMRVSRFETLHDAMKAKGGNVDEFISANFDPAEMTGLKTHYEDFDRKTGGFKEAELIIIGARPSMGKTAWAINIATNIVIEDHDKVVAIFSLEMTKQALYRRMMASIALVSSHRASEGWLTREERTKLATAALKLAPLNLMIDDTPGITPMQMRAKCRRLKQKMGRLDLVVIDYLQLMSAGRKLANRTEEVSFVSRSLKALAKTVGAPVVALAQVGRASERGSDKRPTLADLRESGQIEQDADVVAFIHREEYYKPDEEEVKGLAEIIIAKQREGPTGTVELSYMGDYTRFENLAQRRL